VREVREVFDVLPGGAEAFYFVPHRAPVRGRGGRRGSGGGQGGETAVVKGMWVCRAYEGRRGPQDPRVILDWVRQGGRAVREDQLGRQVLCRMGEAWVWPEQYPKMTKAEREAKERETREAKRMRMDDTADGE
jgi:hypothetical protein